MTAQAPERIIVDDQARRLYSDPLYGLLEARGMADFAKGGPVLSSGCWRCYRGTWEIIGGCLYLIHFSVMWGSEKRLPADLRAKLLEAVSAKDFPVPAVWFDGRLKIPIGRRLVCSHYGWSHWFERQRIVTIRNGMVTRDREVDTQAILERCLLRDPYQRGLLDGSIKGIAGGPLIWFDKRGDVETDLPWPPGYIRPAMTSRNAAP